MAGREGFEPSELIQGNQYGSLVSVNPIFYMDIAVFCISELHGLCYRKCYRF